MTYDAAAIQKLVDRVGWADPVPPSSLSLSNNAKKSDSGRYFNSFHRMAIVENIYDTMPNPTADSAAFNAYLEAMKRSAVLKVLAKVFNTNERANFTEDYAGNRKDISGTDYTDLITNRAMVFDEMIGLQVAIDSIELMMTSNRSNSTERKTKASYQELKGELEGFFNEFGKPIAKGLFFKLEASFKAINEILFPPARKPKNYLRNASNRW